MKFVETIDGEIEVYSGELRIGYLNGACLAMVMSPYIHFMSIAGLFTA